MLGRASTTILQICRVATVGHSPTGEQYIHKIDSLLPFSLLYFRNCVTNSTTAITIFINLNVFRVTAGKRFVTFLISNTYVVFKTTLL